MESPKPNGRGLSRRRAVGLLGAVGTATMTSLAGCLTGSRSDDDDDEETGSEDGSTLEFVHWWTAGGEEDAVEALLEGFLTQYGYDESRVSENPAPGGAGSALAAAVQSRLIDDSPPSVFQLWPGESLAPYTDSDVLADISDSWSTEMRETYLESVQALSRDGDGYVAVPINIHRLNNLFYNTAVVEDVGVEPATLTDPNDLLEAFEAVEDAGYVPLAHQTQDAWPTLQLWETVFVGLHGVESFRALLDRETEAPEPAIAETLELLVDYREYLSPDSDTLAWDQANGQVIAGDAAFTHQGDWAAGQYEATGLAYGEDWGHVAFPGTEGIYAMVLDSFVMPEPNPTPELTAEFLEYCGTVDAQERFNPPKGSIPPRTDVPIDAFPPFLVDQRAAFDASSSQPPTITHGSGVEPRAKSELEETFANLLENWNPEEATERIVEIL